MEWLQDMGVLFVLGVFLYALAGDALKKLGLKPFLLSMLAVVLDGARVAAGWLKIGVTWFGYRVILGRKQWRYVEQTQPTRELQVTAPLAPRTEGAARAHAENTGAPRAGTPPAPLNSSALTPDLLSLIQRIAGHKIVRPADGKEATGKALGFTKSGTSLAWQSYSQAWNLLYPPPPLPSTADDPEAWESSGRGQLRRIRTAAAK